MFREPKSTNQIDEILKTYSQAISESQISNSKITGALLFSVIGYLIFIFYNNITV